MKKKLSKLIVRCIALLSLLVTSSVSGSAQEDFTFVGFVVTSGVNIPFEINLKWYPDGHVDGVSATWKGTDYEVFTKLKVDYDRKSNKLSFLETENMRTKFSDINREFCFVKGSYTVQTENGKSTISGPFTAKKSDGSDCPSGTLRLKSNKAFPPEIKEVQKPEPPPVPPVTIAPKPEPAAPEIPKAQVISIDTVRKGFLYTNNLYKYTTNSNGLKLQWGDFSNMDGDSITVLVNGQPVMNNVQLSSNMKNQIIKLRPSATDTIKVKILNEGKVPPNTSMLNFFDEEKGKYYNFQINGKKDEEFILLILKEN